MQFIKNENKIKLENYWRENELHFNETVLWRIRCGFGKAAQQLIEFTEAQNLNKSYAFKQIGERKRHKNTKRCCHESLRSGCAVWCKAEINSILPMFVFFLAFYAFEPTQCHCWKCQAKALKFQLFFHFAGEVSLSRGICFVLFCYLFIQFVCVCFVFTKNITRKNLRICTPFQAFACLNKLQNWNK